MLLMFAENIGGVNNAAQDAILAHKSEEPPADLAKRVAARETATDSERGHYTYRQSVSINDYSGEYRETRDIIFSPSGERTEVVLGKPSNNLRRLLLTEEDFRDIREVQPMLLTQDTLWLYDSKFRGEEPVNEIDCWLLEIRPRQILDGQRLFDGMLWIDKRDFSIVKSEGKAVPEILTMKKDNLFPRFMTIREKIGEYWFPSKTLADDTLQFRSGPVRMRMRIEYSNYRRFGADSKIEYK
jgi:hypothetical protein